MKKLLIILAMLIALSLVAVGCGETEGDPSQSSVAESEGVESSAQSSDMQSSGTPDKGDDTNQSVDNSGDGEEETDNSDNAGTDSSVDFSSGTAQGSSDSKVPADSSVDSGSADSSVDSGSSEITSNVGSADNSQTTDSSIITPPVDNPPIEEPEEEIIPDGPISIAGNGVTEYTVVYEADNDRIEEFANKFVDYMSETHGIVFDMIHDETPNLPEKCIFIGDVDGASRVKARLNSANDFGACVSGDDYVLYATNDRLYEYLYDMLVEEVLFLIRNKTWNTSPKQDFIYSQSKYKDVRYVDYLLESGDYGPGINRRYYLTRIFEAHTYVAADETVIPYRLYVPYDYDESKEYPVLLFLHGAGERGMDNEGNLYHMFETLFSMENSPFWDCIIIAPQCPGGEQWVDTPWKQGGYRVNEVEESNELKAVLQILRLVENTFPTDTDRYYVTGLSMGGFGAWDLIMRHPEMFAAAVPICGGGDYTQAYKLVDMPIYTLHDTGDREVPNSGTLEMVETLRLLGSQVLNYIELNNNTHNAWDPAANNPEIWEWLFKQTREGR